MILIFFLVLIIIVVIFLIFLITLLFKWLLRKFNIGKLKYRNYLSILLAPIMMVLIATATFKIYDHNINGPINFESSKWKENKYTRHRMAIDIVRSEILIGKNKNQVIELLGLDHKSSPWHMCENGLNYKTYDPYDFGIDHEALIICFKENKVSYVTVTLI